MPLITLQDIPQDQLHNFIQKMDGYLGISVQDKSWVHDKKSKPYKLTLYCFLIAEGVFYVENQRLKSRFIGYNGLIEFVEDFFKGKCIVNFTDLFFLNDINESFNNGNWYNIHESWLIQREDYLEILDKRKPLIHRDPTAFIVEVTEGITHLNYFYFILRGKKATTVIDFLGFSIKWADAGYSTYQFKQDFNLKDARITYSEISLDEFYSRFFDIVTDGNCELAELN